MAGLLLELAVESNVPRADEAKDEGELAACSEDVVFRPPVRIYAEEQCERANAEQQRNDQAEEGLLYINEQHPADEEVAAVELDQLPVKVLDVV
jgi:hypothetical protein